MKIEIKCDHCGKKFWRTQRRVKNNKFHNFCSLECRDIFQRENGKVYQKYSSETQRKLKMLKAERDRRLRLQQ